MMKIYFGLNQNIPDIELLLMQFPITWYSFGESFIYKKQS